MKATRASARCAVRAFGRWRNHVSVLPRSRRTFLLTPGPGAGPTRRRTAGSKVDVRDVAAEP